MAASGQPFAPGDDPGRAVDGHAIPITFLPSDAAPGEAAPILWVAGDLAPVLQDAIPLAEEILHDGKLKKLRTAKLDPIVIREIERDLRWPERSKQMLQATSAKLGAKWLNQFGVSATHKDEVNFGIALLVIMRCEAQVNRRIDALIAAVEKTASAKPAPAVPPAAPLILAEIIKTPAPPPNAPPVVTAKK
ncbi:MAG: hypothetical protein KGJ60_09560 [Verrucomicrobiota bacterium]|nr:hypothetical protein [Verrucomicrobiota bacterium]